MTVPSHMPLNSTVLTPAYRGAVGPCFWLSAAVGTLALLALIILSTPAAAAIFKCVSADGETTYTSAPCAPDESTRRISSTATAVAGLDCRIARKLAFDTARRMKQGESSASVFDSHGGMDSVSPLVMGMISYIYGFDGNSNVSASRVATLATERCQVGSFGNTARHCDVYPHEFIQALGGCEAARDESAIGAPQAARVQTSVLPVDTQAPELGKATPAGEQTGRYAPSSAPSASASSDLAPGVAATRAGSQRASCQQRIGTTLENTNLRLETELSSTEQSRLQALQRQLRMQLARC